MNVPTHSTYYEKKFFMVYGFPWKLPFLFTKIPTPPTIFEYYKKKCIFRNLMTMPWNHGEVFFYRFLSSLGSVFGNVCKKWQISVIFRLLKMFAYISTLKKYGTEIWKSASMVIFCCIEDYKTATVFILRQKL